MHEKYTICLNTPVSCPAATSSGGGSTVRAVAASCRGDVSAWDEPRAGADWGVFTVKNGGMHQQYMGWTRRNMGLTNKNYGILLELGI